LRIFLKRVPCAGRLRIFRPHKGTGPQEYKNRFAQPASFQLVTVHTLRIFADYVLAISSSAIPFDIGIDNFISLERPCLAQETREIQVPITVTSAISSIRHLSQRERGKA